MSLNIVFLYCISVLKSIIRSLKRCKKGLVEYLLLIIIALTRRYTRRYWHSPITAASFNGVNCIETFTLPQSTVLERCICFQIRIISDARLVFFLRTTHFQTLNIWTLTNVLWLGQTVQWFAHFVKKRQILRFYKHGHGQILTLSALIYKPYLILYINHEFYLFQMSSHAFVHVFICISHYCLGLIVLCMSVNVTAVNW